MINLDVAAVDIGYGETKIAWTDKSGPVLESFRSIAVRAPQESLESGLFGGHVKATRVVVNGTPYLVGQRAALAGDTLAVQALHADYIHTSQYRACFHAALATLQAERIAILVTGLPVYQYAGLHAELEHMLTGTHSVTADRMVTVDRVLVMPQPTGGMLEVVNCSPLSVIPRSLTLLIVDAGQGTTDWVTFIRGEPAVKRSGSYPAGVGAIIEGVRSRLLAKYHGAPRAVDLADTLKRGGWDAMVGANRVNLQTEVASSAGEVVGMCMNAMQNTVQTFTDINYVGLIGGGANLIRPALSQALAQTQAKILTVAEPEFANVRGYLLAAKRLLLRQTVRA